MNSLAEIKLSELIRRLQQIHAEIGSHPALDDSVLFYLDPENPDDDSVPLELSDIEVDQSMGCGCWIGAILRFKPIN